MTREQELEQLVQSFVLDTIDYATINKLGDPEKQHNVQWARELGIRKTCRFPDMNAVFEITEPDGRTYRIYADGRAEGFPDGTYIINYLPALLAMAAVGDETIREEERGIMVDEFPKPDWHIWKFQHAGSGWLVYSTYDGRRVQMNHLFETEGAAELVASMLTDDLDEEFRKYLWDYFER